MPFPRLIVTFALVFAAVQVGIELVAGTSLTGAVWVNLLITTAVATGLYAGFIWIVRKMRKQGE